MFQTENYTLFSQIEPSDIKQGMLGDCYYLCSLSSLAERKDLIERLFYNEESPDQKKYHIYSVWLNIFGEWQNIVLDDFMPCRNNGFAFSRAQGQELWVLLLEKAYAKAYGTYEAIEGGNPSVALRDLTGAPYENIDNVSADEFWNFLTKYDKHGYILTCYTKCTDIREEENQLGILAGHAYSILDTELVFDQFKNQCRILQIRNPWG